MIKTNQRTNNLPRFLWDCPYPTVDEKLDKTSHGKDVRKKPYSKKKSKQLKKFLETCTLNFSGFQELEKGQAEILCTAIL